MATMRPPHVPETPPAVYTDDEIRRLLAACEGRAFEDRRDMAIIQLFLDTGMRLAELAGLQLADVDLEENIALVLGKGRRQRACPFGRRTAQALDRYLRAPASHRDKDRPEFWLGLAGPMTPNGVADVVRRRGAAAGIADVHPHRFRHTYAHQWLAASGNEGDLRRLAGGAAEPCSLAIAPRPPSSGPGRRIEDWGRATGTDPRRHASVDRVRLPPRSH